ncbi:MAG: hypothetical protein K8R23_16725 [Chthoniobacter sp.]|nr:hypothetical protein [Chthoniobacter sp.]
MLPRHPWPQRSAPAKRSAALLAAADGTLPTANDAPPSRQPAAPNTHAVHRQHPGPDTRKARTLRERIEAAIGGK